MPKLRSSKKTSKVKKPHTAADSSGLTDPETDTPIDTPTATAEDPLDTTSQSDDITPAAVVGLDSVETTSQEHLSPDGVNEVEVVEPTDQWLKTPLPSMMDAEVPASSSSPGPPFTPTPRPKRQGDKVDERGVVKRRCDVGHTRRTSPVAWVVSDVGIDNLVYELRDSYEFLPVVRSVNDIAEDPGTEVRVCNADMWDDAVNRFPGLSVEHLSEIVRLPTFMGYVNPARSSPVEVTLMTVGGSGHGSFYGLVKARSPLKMISYGVVKYSGLAQAREVHSKTGVLSVKSINIFPLPGEWERTVGFFGTCAKAAQLLFSPFQGALSYTTRMIPAPGTGSARANTAATPRRPKVPPRMATGSDPGGLPLPWDEIPVYDARALCTDEVDITALRSYQKSGLERLGNVDIEVGSFVGVVHCAKWIDSQKHPGKDRVQLSIAEVHLLADPEVDGWASGSLDK